MTGRFEKGIVYFILFMGVLLPLVQFIFNRSLCGDEVWLSLNIIGRDHVGLLRPLEHVQSAPPLFLLIEKSFSMITPGAEYGLKIFPLICYLLSLILFFKILKILCKDGYTLIFALCLFVFNVYIIRYSNEVKQYMTDVMVLVYFYYLVLRTYRKINYQYYYLAIAGVISLFLSNASITILFAVGLYLIYHNYRKKEKRFFYLVAVFLVWAISFAVYYFLFIYGNPVKDAMVTMWSEFFMPANPFTAKFYLFISQRITNLFLTFFQYGNLGALLIIPFVLGIINIIRMRRLDLLILTLVPIVMQFILSAIKLYPIVPRTLLFISPLIMITCGFGFGLVVSWFLKLGRKKDFKLIAAIPPIIMISYFVFLLYVNSYPIKRSEIRNSIQYIERNIQPTDKIYVAHFATWSYEYYDKIGFVKKNNERREGTKNYKNDVTSYNQELASLNGRVWFVFVEFGDDYHENREVVKNYFDSMHQMPIDQFHTAGSDVYLYDLEKPE